MKVLLTALKLGAIAYVAYGVLLYVFQRPLTYHGTRLEIPAGATMPADAELLELDTGDGTVPAWWFPAQPPTPQPALIVAHGNAELIHDNIGFARAMRGLGLGVLLVEYPGYGEAAGAPSRESIGEAFTAAWDQLASRPEVDAERIAGLGRSLGGGAITDLAAARPVRALILQSVFYSLKSMVVRGYGMPPFLVKDDFDNAANLRAWDGPALILHGTSDRVVSASHGERLTGVRDGIRLMRYECGHNDCPWTSDEVLAEVRGFLEEAGVLGGG